MKNFKYLIIAICLIIPFFTFFGCGNNNEEAEQSDTTTNTEEIQKENSPNSNEESSLGLYGLFDDNSKCLLTWDEITTQYPNAFTEKNKIKANNTESYLKDLDGNLNIPSSIEIIDKYAFRNCTKLKKINFYSVKSIGDFAFDGCTNLNSFIIPKTTENIGTGIIKDTAIQNILISVENTKYCVINGSFLIEKETKTIIAAGTSAVQNGILTIPTISSDITAIGDNVFSENTKITQLNISSNITYIGKNAFFNCTNITSLSIPGSVKTIDEYAFGGLNKLESLTLNNGIESIEKYAFGGCSSLTDLIIPNSVNNIEYCGFANCTNLISVKIGNSVSRIYVGFWNDNNLSTVIIDSGNIYANLGSSTDYSNLTTKATTIKILKTIDDNSNTFLNNNYIKNTESDPNYNLYTK